MCKWDLANKPSGLLSTRQTNASFALALKIFSVQTKVRLYVVNPSGLVEFFSALQIMLKRSILSREREKSKAFVFATFKNTKTNLKPDSGQRHWIL